MVQLEERKAVVAPVPYPTLARFWNPRPRSVGALAARSGLGVIMLAHGLQKIAGLWGGAGWSGTLAHFESQLGIPPWLGALAILTEAVGGFFLLVGFLARPAALAVGIEMVVAALEVHVANGFFLNWQMTAGVGHGFEMNLALVALAAVVVLEGPGLLALDSLIERAPPASAPSPPRSPAPGPR